MPPHPSPATPTPGSHDAAPSRVGSRFVQGGKRPVHGAAAARTVVSAAELGGQLPPEDGSGAPPPPFVSRSGYADQAELLHYTEYVDQPPSERAAAPPPRHHSEIATTIASGPVDPTAHSSEPSGLPKRHPGPERLKRGGGINGTGTDHQGRQLATSLVDEVTFGRANYRGKLQLASNNANFAIDAAGEFAHR